MGSCTSKMLSPRRLRKLAEMRRKGKHKPQLSDISESSIAGHAVVNPPANSIDEEFPIRTGGIVRRASLVPIEGCADPRDIEETSVGVADGTLHTCEERSTSDLSSIRTSGSWCAANKVEEAGNRSPFRDFDSGGYFPSRTTTPVPLTIPSTTLDIQGQVLELRKEIALLMTEINLKEHSRNLEMEVLRDSIRALREDQAVLTATLQVVEQKLVDLNDRQITLGTPPHVSHQQDASDASETRKLLDFWEGVDNVK